MLQCNGWLEILFGYNGLLFSIIAVCYGLPVVKVLAMLSNCNLDPPNLTSGHHLTTGNAKASPTIMVVFQFEAPSTRTTHRNVNPTSSNHRRRPLQGSFLSSTSFLLSSLFPAISFRTRSSQKGLLAVFSNLIVQNVHLLVVGEVLFWLGI